MGKKSKSTKSEWGDSFSLSKGTRPIKARILSSHPAQKAEESEKVEKPQPVTAQLDQQAINELKNQWNDLSQEVTKATGSLVHGIDHITAKTIEGGANFFIIITNGIIKAITFPFKLIAELFVVTFRPLLDWLKTSESSSEKTKTESFSVNTFEEEQYEEDAEFITFGTLAQEGIIFYTVKNEPVSNILMENRTLSLEEENSLIDKGMEEIKRCARLSGGLPTPTTGTFADIPMPRILESVTQDALAHFLTYVHKYPRPFIEKKVKLAEAYATWAYKGSPTN